MNAGTRQWLLSFDGKQFSLASHHGPELLTGEYVVEEHVETILAHWGDQILPGSPVQFIGRQASLMAVADLAGVDRFGNRHLLEIKARSYKTAGPGELFQLISYALDKPTSESDLIEAFARAVWYGRRSVAARLAGLIANRRVGNVRSEEIPRDARRGEREDGVLTVMASEAAIRSGLDFDRQHLEDLAGEYMRNRFGTDHDGPIDDPIPLWKAFSASKLGASWQFNGRNVIWLLAPNAEPALAAARPLIARGVDLRIGSLEVRERIPGREWSVRLRFEAEPWVALDQQREIVRDAVNRHISRLPLEERLRVTYSVDAKEAFVSWGAMAGPARMDLRFHEGVLTWKWYSHWWTEGEALAVRDKINATGKQLIAAGAPKELSFDFGTVDGQNACANALAELLDGAWNHLVAIGATKLDRWSIFRSPATKAG